LSFENEGCDKDKEYIIEECHNKENGCNSDGIEFDDGEEEHAHAGTHDVLHYPEEDIVFRVTEGKGENEPCQAKCISRHGRQDFDA